MFKNAIWKNPIGWGMTFGRERNFLMFAVLHIFCFFMMSAFFIFFFLMFNKLFTKCTGYPFGIGVLIVAYTVPYLVCGVVFPISYLYALKILSRELKSKNH